MKNNYSYPIDGQWSVEEITEIVDYYNQVERAYEGGIKGRDFLNAQTKFDRLVKSKAQRREMDKSFEADSSYVPFAVYKAAKQNPDKVIKM